MVKNSIKIIQEGFPEQWLWKNQMKCADWKERFFHGKKIEKYQKRIQNMQGMLVWKELNDIITVLGNVLKEMSPSAV